MKKALLAAALSGLCACAPLVAQDQNPFGEPAPSHVIVDDDHGVVTLRGTVPDEDARRNIVARVEQMPRVTRVHDALVVASKSRGLEGGSPQTH